MLKRIQLECRGKKHEEIKELNLDNRRTTGEVEGLTDEFIGLEKLSMNGVGLTTLKGFPALANLKRLELSDNRISGTLDCLHSCPKLTHLNLSGNKIRSFDTLKPLSSLKDLNTLDLFNCDVTNEDGYRKKMFAMIPHLEYLDGFDQNDQEAIDSEEEDAEDDDVPQIDKELSDDELNGEVDDEDDNDDEDEEGEEITDGDTEDSNLLATDSNQAPVDSDDDDSSFPPALDEESESEEEEEVGLDYLYKDDIQDNEEDDNDYNEEEVEDDDDLEEDFADEDLARGVKRKREPEETSNQSGAAGDA